MLRSLVRISKIEISHHNLSKKKSLCKVATLFDERSNSIFFVEKLNQLRKSIILEDRKNICNILTMNL